MAKPPAILVLLLKIVPTFPQQIAHGLAPAEIYDTVLAVIAENRTDDFVEWAHLDSICRRERAARMVRCLKPVASG